MREAAFCGITWTDWALTAGLAFTVVPILEPVKWLERCGYTGEST
jgi:hypothetical protein